MEPAGSDRSVLINERSVRRTFQPGMEIRTMSKYERRMFFERLVELRATYGTADHAATTMTVEQAIAHAIDLFDHPDRLDAILADGSTDNSSELHPA
jgi:hypothetical protein